MPARGQSKKKKHHPGCFFFCCGPGERQGKEKPRWAPARGQSKNKTPPRVFFFGSGPVPAPNAASASPAFHRGRSKKQKHHGWCFFFALAPCRRPTGLLLPLPFAGAAGWCFLFFALAPCRHGASPSPAFPWGRSKKNTLGGFFLLPKGRNKKKHFAHPGPTAKNLLETNDAGHEQKGATTKKKHPGRERARRVQNPCASGLHKGVCVLYGRQ